MTITGGQFNAVHETKSLTSGQKLEEIATTEISITFPATSPSTKYVVSV